jgi:hypothetical protein
LEMGTRVAYAGRCRKEEVAEIGWRLAKLLFEMMGSIRDFTTAKLGEVGILYLIWSLLLVLSLTILALFFLFKKIPRLSRFLLPLSQRLPHLLFVLLYLPSLILTLQHSPLPITHLPTFFALVILSTPALFQPTHFLPRVLLAIAITFSPMLLPKLFFILAISFTYFAVLTNTQSPLDYIGTFLLSIMCTPSTVLAALIYLILTQLCQVISQLRKSK